MRTRFGASVTTIAALAVLVALASACGSSGAPASTSTSHPAPAPAPATCGGTGSVAHENLRYASTPGVAPDLQSLDLYVPALRKGCPATPLVAYVHGGGFHGGDKANRLTDKVNLFTKAGWALASLNYRLVGNAGSGATNGQYPAAEEDIGDAIGLLAHDAARYHLDARKVMLLGHSAGAFLVALVSTDGSFLARAGVPLSDVVCTAPLDTSYDIPAQVALGGVNGKMFESAFGSVPAVWAQGSPIRNVESGKGIPSFHIVTRGSRRRVAGAEAFGAGLRKAGVPADVQNVTGLTHEDVNAAVGAPGETVVTPPLMAFYRGCVTR